MTSNDSRWSFDKDSPNRALTYKELLQHSERYQRVVELFRGPHWEALRDLMEAERLLHQEALSSSDQRAEMFRHQGIVRWLESFLDAAGLRAELQAIQQGMNRKPTAPAGYMQKDSGRLNEEP